MLISAFQRLLDFKIPGGTPQISQAARPLGNLRCYLICAKVLRLLSCMTFIVYEATFPEKQGVNKLTTRQTSHANDYVHAKSHAREKPLLAG